MSGDTIPTRGRPEQYSGDVRRSGNILIAPSFFNALTVTKEWRKNTSIAAKIDLEQVFSSGCLQSGEEDKMLTDILNHHLGENRDCQVRKEWICRHWKS